MCYVCTYYTSESEYNAQSHGDLVQPSQGAYQGHGLFYLIGNYHHFVEQIK